MVFVCATGSGAALTVLTTTFSIIIDGVGGGGGGGAGGLDLHTLGCAYFKFFNNIVLPHKSHVPVGALFCFNSFSFDTTLTSSSDGIDSSSFGGSGSTFTSTDGFDCIYSCVGSFGIFVIGSCLIVGSATFTTLIFLGILIILYR